MDGVMTGEIVIDDKEVREAHPEMADELDYSGRLVHSVLRSIRVDSARVEISVDDASGGLCYNIFYEGREDPQRYSKADLEAIRRHKSYD